MKKINNNSKYLLQLVLMRVPQKKKLIGLKMN